MDQEMAYLVQEIKSVVFSPSADIYSFLQVSAYDTAWVAMIPDPHQSDHPMFPQCLDWILFNQNDTGFWGEHDCLDSITTTLACLLALRKWDTGSENVENGLKFLHANMEKLLVNNDHSGLPRWFVIVFPGMLELAQANGLDVLPQGFKKVVQDVFDQRLHILENGGWTLPVESYLEALPASYDEAKHEEILKRYQSEDGSLLQSPSATACAFMATGNIRCMAYLEAMVERCGHGVYPMYPVDEELIKLCLVDHLERLGCGEYFTEEISEVMEQAYRNWTKEQEPQVVEEKHNIQLHIYKDSLAFQLLRMHNYQVSPERFCWFVDEDEMLLHIKDNYSDFLGAMYNIYKASHLSFPNEPELEKARAFSRKILRRGMPYKHATNYATTPAELQEEIEHELRTPWLARIVHLERRRCIENGGTYCLWIGKAPYCRFSVGSTYLQMRLAESSFTQRQSIYRAELEEMKRWSNNNGLSKMGFGREKTTYCYFGIAAVSSLPLISSLRKIIAKCAIMITVADDLFDEKASLDELHSLTNAIMRWEGDGLSGSTKVIFNALDDLVTEIASNSPFQQGDRHFKPILQDIWRETFETWLKEAIWSRTGYAPSIEEYLEVGMVSIAVEIMLFSACCLMSPNSLHYFTKSRHSTITTLLMISCRMLNDTQSYQKEAKDGKLNLVLLYMRENLMANIEEAVTQTRSQLDAEQKKFLEHVKSIGYSDMPCELKELHLSCLKTFQMFFNSSNAFDSQTALLQNINMAIYEPLEQAKSSLDSGQSDMNRTQLQDYGRFVKVEGPQHRRNNKLPVKSKGMAFEVKTGFRLTSDRKISLCTHPMWF